MDNVEFSFYDQLTGLPNRKYLIEYYEINKDEDIFLALLDIDNFKLINDAYGHITGDKVITYVSDKIFSLLGKNNMIFRFCSDKFIIIFKKKSYEEIIRYIENIISEFNNVYIVDDKEFFTSISVGLHNVVVGETLEESIRKADIALFYSKREGKNCYNIFTDEMDNIVKKKADLMIELKKAVDNNMEFYIVYQPIYNVENNRIEAIEALTRWHNCKYGEITPGEFIPMLEETGLIEKFGFNMILKVLEDLHHIRNNGFDIKINVNISPLQLKDENFFDKVNAILNKQKINFKNISFELTETQMLNLKIDRIKEIMQKGIKISLDDFGTGYSSLVNVMKLPINQVKIDKCIVDKIEFDKKARILVEGIVFVADKLGSEVVVEGVENKNQFEILKNLGVKKIQGYFISKPLKVNELIELLNRFETER